MIHARTGDWRSRLPFFYGWFIVAGSLVALGLTYSVMYSFSVFYVALLEEFGWGRGEAAGVYSVFMIVTGIGALGAGAMSDRFGPGRVLACGSIWLAMGLLACSRVTELWHLYVAFGVMAGFGVSLAGWTPCVIMVSRWFTVRLGLALGIASAGIGVGIMVVVPLVQILISSFGWRAAYVVLAGIVVVGLLLQRLRQCRRSVAGRIRLRSHRQLHERFFGRGRPVGRCAPQGTTDPDEAGDMKELSKGVHARWPCG